MQLAPEDEERSPAMPDRAVQKQHIRELLERLDGDGRRQKVERRAGLPHTQEELVPFDAIAFQGHRSCDAGESERRAPRLRRYFKRARSFDEPEDVSRIARYIDSMSALWS